MYPGTLYSALAGVKCIAEGSLHTMILPSPVEASISFPLRIQFSGKEIIFLAADRSSDIFS
jgi:hypothetical protein